MNDGQVIGQRYTDVESALKLMDNYSKEGGSIYNTNQNIKTTVDSIDEDVWAGESKEEFAIKIKENIKEIETLRSSLYEITKEIEKYKNQMMESEKNLEAVIGNN